MQPLGQQLDADPGLQQQGFAQQNERVNPSVVWRLWLHSQPESFLFLPALYGKLPVCAT
jgi:hypothetical protein